MRWLRSRLAALHLPVLAALDLLITCACYAGAAAILLPIPVTLFLFSEDGLGKILLAAGSVVLAMQLHGLYTHEVSRWRMQLALDLVSVFGIVIVAQAFLTYGRINLALPARTSMLGSAFAFVVLLAWRVFYCSVLGRRRILFVGVTPLTLQIARQLEKQTELGMEVVGYVDDGAEESGATKVLGPLRQLKEIALAVHPDVVVAPELTGAGAGEISAMRRAGFHIESAAVLYETAFGRLYTANLSLSALVLDTSARSRPTILALQSIYTNLIALGLVLFSIPLLLLLGIAVRLTSPGPSLLGEECAGLAGIPFTRLRFRCTREVRQSDGTTRSEVTWLGRLLLKYHLDGLPQCFNVLRGEMSLVGPPPDHVEATTRLSEQIPLYSYLHAVKPGIVGWSQINLAGSTTGDTLSRLEYDLYYVKHISPALDAAILLRAIGKKLAAATSRGGSA
jgi:lipopolysaccharide/colanic/teichoic acid biosynthesis glycosyltransferase